MSRPKLHHVVPRFFLRRFADDEDRVTVAHRDQPSRTFTANIAKVLVAKKFYDCPIDGAPNVWWLESLLSDLERVAKPALDRIDAGIFPPEGNDREVLRTFVAACLVRGHRVRDMLPHAWKANLDSPFRSREELRTLFRQAGLQEPSDSEADRIIADSHEAAKTRPPIPDHAGAQVTPVLTDGVSMHLQSRTWHLLRFPEPVLLTGDAPVALNHRILRRDTPLGINSDEIFMPIDPQHAVFLLNYRNGDGTVAEGTLELAQKMNFTVASQCVRWIVYHPALSPLTGMPSFGTAAETFVRYAK